MSSPTQAIIDTQALAHNLQQVRQHAASSQVMAVIKADGYGHGILAVADALNAADGFAVARLSEAITLRQHGINKPILLLEGVFDVTELTLALQHQLQIVVHHESQLQLLEQHLNKRTISVWLKIDSGMHRLGFPLADFQSAKARLERCCGADNITLMTHLANADNRQDITTLNQLHHFMSLLHDGTAVCSVANSAGVLAWPETHKDWVRPGIMLYGSSPFVDDTASQYNLRPVMTLQSKIIAINHYQKGDAIGYGGVSRCPHDMAVGVVAIGYGDGYPRHAKPGTPVLLNDQLVGLLGRVSMDMISIDLHQQPQAKIGDTATLWGQGLPAEVIAQRVGTISYELFCQVTSRVPRIYI